MVGDFQSGHNLALRRDQLSQRRVDRIPAGVGHLNKHTPPIIWVIVSRHQTPLDKPVHPVRHCSGRD